MATGPITQISDVIVPEAFTPYVQQLTEEKARLPPFRDSQTEVVPVPDTPGPRTRKRSTQITQKHAGAPP